MKITGSCQDGVLTLRFQGELDHHVSRQAAEALSERIDAFLPRSCVLDLRGLSFMDSSGIALILRGKHKPTFTPHVDTGDYVIVINAEKMVLTGKKLDDKMYTHYTGFPGGLTETSYRIMMAKKPEFVLHEAVRGMLPHGPLGYKMIKKLHVYRGAEHEHQAQKPVSFDLKTLNK